MSKKSKASGVSAGSFFDLKAELSKREDELAKSRSTAISTALVGGVKRPGKKPTIWARPNKGVESRNRRDIELEKIDTMTMDKALAKLEQKAAMYEKLKKGQSGGFNDQQYEELLVDFDRKAIEEGFSDSGSDVDESLTVPRPPDEDDPLVEYEDEFGRLRTARRSEVPRDLPRQEEEPDDFDDPYLLRGEQTAHHFPVFEPSEERKAAIAESVKETDPATHYSAKYENRAKGAGFYNFSGTEAERQKAQGDLRSTREETVRKRKQEGVDDDAETEEDEGPVKKKEKVLSKAQEKAKQKQAERKRLVDESRRKALGDKEVERRREEAKAKETDDFLAALERDMIAKKGDDKAVPPT